MAAITLSSIRLFTPLGVAIALAPAALAGDVSVKLDGGSGFVIENGTGEIERLRVDEATGNVSRNGALFVHTTGANNLFIGAGAGNTETTGDGGNTAVGAGALHSITSGSHNLAVGRYAGQNQTTGSDNIYLANDGVAAESGRIRIGTSSTHTATFIAGIHGANLGGSGVPVYVTASGQLGTSGGTQPPWTEDIDAADFDLTGLRRLAFGPVLETNGGFNVDLPNSTGYGFTIASAESALSVGAGIARDTTATIGFNWNAGGTNHGTPFNPFLGLSFESNFPNDAWPVDSLQEFHIIAGSGRTTGTVANGAGFAAGQVISVEEPGNGATVGTGVIKTIGAGPGATAVIDWIYSGAAGTNPPASGDTLEGESSTTVTNRSGTFVMDGGGLWVYPSATCGVDGSTATAILGLNSIANQTGTVADLAWLRSSGSGANVVSGNCVRQSGTGATALLGAVSVAASTSFTSPPTATNDGSWRPMTTKFAPHGQAMTSWWFGNRALMDTGVPTLRIGTTEAGQTGHWLSIASSITGPAGNDYVGAIGSSSADENFAIWGRWWIFEPGGFDRVSLGATAVTGTRTQDFADVSGTIAAFTDLSGCADDAPLVASGATGGIKCGSASLASPSASLLLVQPAPFGSEPDQTLPSDDTALPEPGPSVDAVALLWSAMQEQQRRIEDQASEIASLRKAHAREVDTLTTRLARVEARGLGAGRAKR